MTKFILHGGFTSAKNELNAGFYREITKTLPNNATVLLVYFSREDNEIDKLFEEDKNRIIEQADDKQLNFVLASPQDFLQQLKETNAIYMRGGGTDKLLKVLKQHPEFEEEIKGKVVAGSSAGAYVLAKYYHSAQKDGVMEGLGILPIRIICHYQSDKFKSRGNPIEEIKKYPNNLDLIILKDYEWKIIDQ